MLVLCEANQDGGCERSLADRGKIDSDCVGCTQAGLSQTAQERGSPGSNQRDIKTLEPLTVSFLGGG